MKSPETSVPQFDLIASSFRSQLLFWYNTHARDLPWRRSRDPYRIWISEIMLQQTRVAAVIEHYHEFLRRFPTVQKLAAARESSVLAGWSGLGYYRRARMLHAAAKLIARRRDGKFPTTAAEWLDLPGIGRYTAAAIASIAFGEPVAVVDGNVERVLQRVLGNRLAKERIWQAAGALLDPNRPGDFNQAMMELGAVVCAPRAPACLTCAVVNLCAARGELPATSVPARQQKRDIHYALICRRNHKGQEVFVVQRPRNACLMAGMWELPQAIVREAGEPVFTLKHSITTTDYSVMVYRKGLPAGADGKWITGSQARRMALTGLARKILIHASILWGSPEDDAARFPHLIV